MPWNKETKPFADFEFARGGTVEYPSGVKSAVFRSQFQAYRVSSHSDELWYNETDCLWMDYIYIYIILD